MKENNQTTSFKMAREKVIELLKECESKDQRKQLTPSEERQMLIMVQSCQKDAVGIVRTKYLSRGIKTLNLSNKVLIKEVQDVRDLLFDDIDRKSVV